jgi:hypothetical protein
MLQRTLNFLQTVFQELLPAPSSSIRQATQQMVQEQDRSILQPVATMTNALNETGPLPEILPAQERITGPYRAIVRQTHPAQRYRDLDALLEQFKRDRLHTVDTRLEIRAVYRPVRKLQPVLEQKDQRKR